MKKVESTSDESKEFVALTNAQPQAEQKKKYYRDIMLACEELYNSVQDRLKKGHNISVSFLLGFIPVITLHRFGKLEKSRLKVELHDLENKIYVQQQYYETWHRTTKQYTDRIDEVTRECNQQFDNVLEAAKKIKSNPRLQQAIANYKNEDNDNTLKIEYYLYLKQEVNNNQVLGKKR
jgi:hypothetical protein